MSTRTSATTATRGLHVYEAPGHDRVLRAQLLAVLARVAYLLHPDDRRANVAAALFDEFASTGPTTTVVMVRINAFLSDLQRRADPLQLRRAGATVAEVGATLTDEAAIRGLAHDGLSLSRNIHNGVA